MNQYQLEQARIESELLPRSLHNFTKEAFPNALCEGKRFVDGYHIGLMCEALEALYLRQIMGLVVNIPPRHMKSTLCSVIFPAWVWTKTPHETFLTASHDMKLSTRDAMEARRLIASPWYKARWANKFHLTSDQNTKTHYDNNLGGKRLAYSVGAGGIGEGGEYRILDDPHNPRVAASEAVKDSDMDWLDNTWAFRRNDPYLSVMLCVKQRLAEADASNYYIDLGHSHLMLPARFEASRKSIIDLAPARIVDKDIPEKTGPIEDTREEGEVLWPERFDEETVSEDEAKGPEYTWNTQQQQRPSAKGGSLVKKKWWRYWKHDPTSAELSEGVRVLPESFKIMFQSWDATFGSKSKTASYVVGQLWGVNWPDMYLIDQVRDRMGFNETCDVILSMTALWHSQGYVTRKILVEKAANGHAIIEQMEDKIPGVHAINPIGSKVERLIASTPMIRTHHVWIPADAEWTEGYLKEHTLFPNAANDDQVDATSQAIDDAQQNNVTMLTVIDALPRGRMGMI